MFLVVWDLQLMLTVVGTALVPLEFSALLNLGKNHISPFPVAFESNIMT